MSVNILFQQKEQRKKKFATDEQPWGWLYSSSNALKDPCNYSLRSEGVISSTAQLH